MSKFTVWVIEPDGGGACHVSSHEALTADEAAELAMEKTAMDWDWPKDADLCVLGIATGDIEIVEWAGARFDLGGFARAPDRVRKDHP